MVGDLYCSAGQESSYAEWLQVVHSPQTPWQIGLLHRKFNICLCREKEKYT